MRNLFITSTIITFISLVMFTQSCFWHEEAKVGARTPVPINDWSDQTFERANPPLFKLGRQLGECFGKCAVYTVSIYEDGKVVFQGIKNVKALGLHTTTIGADQIK